ncbi:MAG TPA: ABC transporter permease [Pseudonocardiaceae bacterium]|jgi:ABC-2 type transport system permease protein|nr:ABC transporter permease [Pseudonocardiaceae bacterium]
MTSAVAEAPPSPARPVPVARSYRFELVKLLSQWRVRVLLIACLIGPAGFVVAVGQQSSLPSDTTFGRWMSSTGWAGPLVLLGFSGTYALPLLTSLIAGDVFAVEDRLGTWRHLLVAVRSYQRIFAAKTLASLTVIVLLVVGLAASAIVGGLASVGAQPLVGLDGHLLSSGDTAGKVLLAWLCVLAPTLALGAIGLLGSVALGRSPMGLILPVLVALAMGLAQLLPLPIALRLALPSYGFIAWIGLFTDPVQAGPLLISIAVCLVWAVVATVLAYRLFIKRDFTNLSNDGGGRRALVVGVVPLVVVLLLTVGVITWSARPTGSGIDKDKLQRSVATAFAHLYRLQASQMHHPDVTESAMGAAAACTKGTGQVVQDGAGTDWRCAVVWHLPGVTAGQSAVYELDVTSDGRYQADGDGPLQINGYFMVHTGTGDQPNPLWQFDGNVDLLPSN